MYVLVHKLAHMRVGFQRVVVKRFIHRAVKLKNVAEQTCAGLGRELLDGGITCWLHALTQLSLAEGGLMRSQTLP